MPLFELVMLAAATPAAAQPVPPPIIAEQMVEAPAEAAVDGPAVPQIPAEAPTVIPAPPAAVPAEADDAAASDDIIVVVGQQVSTPGDPLEQINATTYEISRSVDRAFVAPVAAAYEEVLPSPLRSGLRNFLQNLLEPVNFLNGLLQLKPDLAFEALGRFALNSTLGLGGIIDVAKREPFGMEFRRNGFSNTLGYYGVDDGAFLILPLVGATTVRDLIGSTIDQAMVPFLVGPPLNTPYYAIPAYTVNSLEFRVKYDARYDAISNSDDPYAAMRENYLCEREADIADLHGRPPPRDCSIEAIMTALDGDEAAYDDEPEVEPEEAEPVAEPVAAPVTPGE